MNKLKKAGTSAILSILLLLFSGTASSQVMTVANTITGSPGCGIDQTVLSLVLVNFDQEYYKHRVIEAGGLRYGNQQTTVGPFPTDITPLGDFLDDEDSGGLFSPLTGAWPLPAATEITVTYYIRGTFDGPALYQRTVVIDDCANPTIISNVGSVPEARATFEVNKVFTDGNTDEEVDVTLNCFTGLPITQSQSISENQNVVFVVTAFDDGELDCDVTEEDVSGYSAEYDNGTETSSESCEYDDVLFGQEAVCTITNSPDPVEVTVTKDWEVDGAGGNQIDPTYSLTLWCDNEIKGGTDCGDKNGYYDSCYLTTDWYKVLTESGTGNTQDADYTADVVPTWNGGTDCRVEEEVYDSSVEVDATDCEDWGDINVEIAGAGENECTIVNTVFFEGIPTLSQYGMAIMALLMLGVGFVGFRRFS